VGLGGLEPPTSPLSGARSSHLSYRPLEHGRNCLQRNQSTMAAGSFATAYESICGEKEARWAEDELRYREQAALRSNRLR
jgi:hypothetical protein